jgi:hypothetical protein
MISWFQSLLSNATCTATVRVGRHRWSGVRYAVKLIPRRFVVGLLGFRV